ncbi:hypothetical protein HDU84_007026 [Entophlyctis sp. JEL0112]|nr:hypothetical protein HDU84_007026 [Entophlyctis sp. JEL0112]
MPKSTHPLSKTALRWELTAALLTTAVVCFLGWSANDVRRMRALANDVCPTYRQPDISVPVFAETRPRLFSVLADTFADHTRPHTIILPTASHVLHAESDAEYSGWKQSANLKYLFDQFPVDGGVVTLDQTPLGYDITVYLPEQTEREIAFLGEYPSEEVIKGQFQVDNVLSVTELPARLTNMTKGGFEILSTVSILELYKALPRSVIDELTENQVKIQFSSEALQAFYQSRFVKTPAELQRLIYASRLAFWVHKQIEQLVLYSKVINEIELHTEFVRLSALCGGDLQSCQCSSFLIVPGSFPKIDEPIVGAKENSAVLHYRTGFNRTLAHLPIPEASFVLVDAAPEFVGYTSDLTRTYPRGNKWTNEMKEVYGIVERVQEKFLNEHYQEGANWAEITQLSRVDLTDELIRSGFILGSLQEAVDKGVAGVFMPHGRFIFQKPTCKLKLARKGLGHPVGLEVHDPTPESTIDAHEVSSFESLGSSYFAWSKDAQPVLHAATMANFTVFRGHICTVEPGVYFIPRLLTAAREGPLAQYINWEKIDAGGYATLGGVRIEDIVLIDHDGRKRIITRWSH